MSALQQLLSRKTDQELLFYVNNPNKHTLEAVRLAIAELQQRNVYLSTETLDEIEKHFAQIRRKGKYGLNHWNKVGLGLILSGFAMFFIGVHFFTYQGPGLNPIINLVGLYSFMLWFPHIIIGIVFMFIRTSKVNL